MQASMCLSVRASNLTVSPAGLIHRSFKTHVHGDGVLPSSVKTSTCVLVQAALENKQQELHNGGKPSSNDK